MNEKELKELKLLFIEKRKREFEKAKRERKALCTPMAERADLKSVQYQFESGDRDDPRVTQWIE